MRVSVLGALAGVALGAGATALLAKTQIGKAATDSLGRLGVPTGAVGDGDALAIVRKLDPAGATQIETAAIVTVLGGAVVAVLAYVIVENVVG
jgi:hypothetical protein